MTFWTIIISLYNNQGKQIKRIRKDLGGLKQNELADKLNVSIIVIKRAEQNKVRFLKKNYIKLMNYYNEHLESRESVAVKKIG